MKTLFLTLITLLLGFQLQAQITGLWEVTQVQLGDQTPTPTAKWFDLKENGQMLSGNGGIINQRGSWQIKNAQLTFYDLNGQADPAGAFMVKTEEDQMTLEREEEGMSVKVSLQRIENIPMASWDHLLGAWRIKEIWAGDENITADKDPEKKYNLFIRWDHLFTARNDLQGHASHGGIWQIHSHRAELRLQSFDNKTNELWRMVEIDQNQMVLESMNENEVTKLVFGR
ncbi:MAG: hypothetical protein Sapg2KO_13380 [Saprospiraceae bacterium]